MAVECGLAAVSGLDQSFSLTYVGSADRKLLVQKQYDPTLYGNPNFVPVGYGGSGLYLTTNGTTSDYDSLQAQFQRRLAHGLQMLMSYAWAHAIDDASNTSKSSHWSERPLTTTSATTFRQL